MLIKYLAGILVGLFLIVGFSENNVTKASELTQTGTIGLLFQLVNQVRAEHGLPPFQVNQALMITAQNQANFNAANSYYGHTGTGGTRPQDRANAAGYIGVVVENVVGGTDLTPQQGITWWLNSPTHYNTLITTRYSEAGTGYATDGEQNHYTLVVGRRSNEPLPSAPAFQPAGPPAIVIPIVLSEPGEDGSIIHKVQTGQTLWAIAARYEVKLGDLRLFNNLPESALLRPGDELIIQLAEGQEPPPTPTPPLTHIARQGETFWTIAATYRLKLFDLLWLNGLNEETILRPGDELIIRLAPGQPPPPTPTPQISHIVQTGDSIWVVAAKYGLTVEDLLEFNDLDADSILQPGDELRIKPLPEPTPVPTAPPLLVDPTPTPPAMTPVTAGSTVIALSPPKPTPTIKIAAIEPVIPLSPPPSQTSAINETLEQGIVTSATIIGIGLILLGGIAAVVIKRER